MMRALTIAGCNYYFGPEAFCVGQRLRLIKDTDNAFDDEAICVMNDTGVVLGHVANSIHTVARGTYSAGRIYDLIAEKQYVKVLYVIDKYIIAGLEEGGDQLEASAEIFTEMVNYEMLSNH